MRIIVCGGKRFSDLKLLDRVLDAVHRKKHIRTLVTGEFPGAEQMAYYWAIRARIETIITVPMRPDMIGALDVRRRNEDMLQRFGPDAVIAFPGRSETSHLAELAERHDIFVWRVPPDWR